MFWIIRGPDDKCVYMNACVRSETRILHQNFKCRYKVCRQQFLGTAELACVESEFKFQMLDPFQRFSLLTL